MEKEGSHFVYLFQPQQGEILAHGWETCVFYEYKCN